jgi:predicted GIY-YIG superfamily endonuclease
MLAAALLRHPHVRPQTHRLRLKNENNPPVYYTGLTSNLRERLDAHNAGRCRHTASGRPWHVDVILKFADEVRAVAFERYLKSGSGGAFAVRHLR